REIDKEYLMTKDAKTDKPRRFPDNVSLYLNPRGMELAENLAEESGMPLRAYLTEALKYVLQAHAGRVGKLDRYVAEFKSSNRSKVAVWRPEKQEGGVDADAGHVAASRSDARDADREFGDQWRPASDAAHERDDRDERGRGRQRSENSEDSGSRSDSGERRQRFGHGSGSPSGAGEGREGSGGGSRSRSDAGDRRKRFGEDSGSSSGGGERGKRFGEGSRSSSEGGERGKRFGEGSRSSSEGGERGKRYGEGS